MTVEKKEKLKKRIFFFPPLFCKGQEWRQDGSDASNCAWNFKLMEITSLSSNRIPLIPQQALALSSIPCTQVSRQLQCHEVREKGQFLVSFSSYLNQSVFSSSSEHFQPQQIVKSLVPSWNTLVFFEVSPVSFHQARSCLLFIF